MIGRLTEDARGPVHSFGMSPERQGAEAGKQRLEAHCPFGKKGKEGRSWRRTHFNVRERVLDTPVCKSSTLPQPLLPAASVSFSII